MRSYNNIIKLTVVLCGLFLAGACTKNYEEINTDPTLVTKDVMPPSAMFTSVLKGSIFSTFDLGILSNYASYYSAEDQGNIFQNMNWTDPFNTYYRSYIINMAEVARLTASDPNLKNEHAMSRIWKAWLFHQLTDMYGDIPYFEAVLDVDSVIFQPKYDTQQAIYEDLLKELKEASAELTDDPNLASFGAADILFNGNVENWKRFANSLRLRLAIHARYADPSLAQENISDVISQPLIDDNSLNAKLATIDGADNNNKNPLYLRALNTNNYPVWVSFTTTENLLKLNDPRLSVFANPASDGVSGYRGRPLQLLDQEKLRYTVTSTASLPASFMQPVYSIIVMNAAEVYLLRAEAAQAGLSSEDPQSMYSKGIQASLEQYAVDPSDITDYLTSGAGTLSGTDEEKLEQIAVQKWLAMYYESNEGWTEFRRTGYPKIWTGSEKGVTDGNIPRRLTYPQDEYSKNEVNVKEAATHYANGDDLMSKLWWDQKPGVPFAHPKQGTFPPEE
jgi:hypothetical protein